MVTMLVIVLIDIDDRVQEVIEGDVIEGLHLVLGGDIDIEEDLVHPLLVYPGVQGEEGEEALLGEVVKAAIEVVEVPLPIKKILTVEVLVKRV